MLNVFRLNKVLIRSAAARFLSKAWEFAGIPCGS